MSLITKLIPGLLCPRPRCGAKVRSTRSGVMACDQGHDLRAEDFPPGIQIQRIQYLNDEWGMYAMRSCELDAEEDNKLRRELEEPLY